MNVVTQETQGLQGLKVAQDCRDQWDPLVRRAPLETLDLQESKVQKERQETRGLPEHKVQKETLETKVRKVTLVLRGSRGFKECLDQMG